MITFKYRYLLTKKVKDKKLLARVHGDRRDEYMKWRYAFMEKKYDKQEQYVFEVKIN